MYIVQIDDRILRFFRVSRCEALFHDMGHAALQANTTAMHSYW